MSANEETLKRQLREAIGSAMHGLRHGHLEYAANAVKTAQMTASLITMSGYRLDDISTVPAGSVVAPSPSRANEGDTMHETQMLILRELRERHQSGRMMTDRVVIRAPTVPDVDMNVYAQEPHPIDGTCLLLRLTEQKWSMEVYAPGFVPNPAARGGVIGTYCSRPHGSAGIAVDTYIREGRGWKHKLPEMEKAEQTYVAPTGERGGFPAFRVVTSAELLAKQEPIIGDPEQDIAGLPPMPESIPKELQFAVRRDGTVLLCAQGGGFVVLQRADLGAFIAELQRIQQVCIRVDAKTNFAN